MKNKILLLLLSILYAGVCICCLAEHNRRLNRKEKAVYLPTYMVWVGAVTAGAFTGFAWFASIRDGSIGLTVCFGIFAVLGMSLMLGWKNCFVVYDNTGFTQRNLLSKDRRFTYDQLTGWSPNRGNPLEATLYADGKKVSFHLLSASGADFLATANAGYKRAYGRKKIPEQSPLSKERGGFCAHVYNPGEYLVIFIMMVALIIGLGGWIVIDGLQPIVQEDCQHYSVTFTSWEIREDELILTAQQMQEPFIVSGYDAYFSNFRQFAEACDGGKHFSVWAKQFHPEDSGPLYRVYALSSDDAVYRTFEDSTAYKRSSVPAIAGIFGIMLAIILAFSAFIYIVGSHPQKFPKWVVYSCFKKDAIDIS